MKKYSILTYVLPCLLMGCQSTQIVTAQTDTTGSDLVSSNDSHQAAKQQLKESFDYQLRHAFSYETDIKISRDESVLNEPSLANCQKNHDDAYVVLLKQAIEQDADIEAPQYSNQREEIKAQFLDCVEQTKTDDDEEITDYRNYYKPLFLTILSSVLSDDDNVSVAKQIQLDNSYLYEPLSINITGAYKPIVGKAYVLPMVNFNRRNTFVSINQPIYIDIKNSEIYVWADNFAYVTSQVFDDKLGNNWKNKWLKVSLEDGSLPDGMGKDLMAFYLQAMQAAYEEEPIEGFDFVDTKQVTALLPPAHSFDVQALSQSSQVIRRQHGSNIDAQQTYIFNRTFFDLVDENYPDFIDFREQEDRDSLIDSKFIVTALLKNMSESLKGDMEKDEEQEQLSAADTTAINKQQFYGFDDAGKLQWIYYHGLALDSGTATEMGIQHNKSITIDAFTQLSSQIQMQYFSNLPQGMQQPTQANTVDMSEYLQALKESYESGKNNTAFGRYYYYRYGIYNDTDTSDDEDNTDIIDATEAVADDAEAAEPVE